MTTVKQLYLIEQYNTYSFLYKRHSNTQKIVDRIGNIDKKLKELSNKVYDLDEPKYCLSCGTALDEGITHRESFCTKCLIVYQMLKLGLAKMNLFSHYTHLDMLDKAFRNKEKEALDIEMLYIHGFLTKDDGTQMLKRILRFTVADSLIKHIVTNGEKYLTKLVIDKLKNDYNLLVEDNTFVYEFNYIDDYDNEKFEKIQLLSKQVGNAVVYFLGVTDSYTNNILFILSPLVRRKEDAKMLLRDGVFCNINFEIDDINSVIRKVVIDNGLNKFVITDNKIASNIATDIDEVIEEELELDQNQYIGIVVNRDNIYTEINIPSLKEDKPRRLLSRMIPRDCYVGAKLKITMRGKLIEKTEVIN